jgi:hypothetical protein
VNLTSTGSRSAAVLISKHSRGTFRLYKTYAQAAAFSPLEDATGAPSGD